MPHAVMPAGHVALPALAVPWVLAMPVPLLPSPLCLHNLNHRVGSRCESLLSGRGRQQRAHGLKLVLDNVLSQPPPS